MVVEMIKEETTRYLYTK